MPLFIVWSNFDGTQIEESQTEEAMLQRLAALHADPQHAPKADGTLGHGFSVDLLVEGTLVEVKPVQYATAFAIDRTGSRGNNNG